MKPKVLFLILLLFVPCTDASLNSTINVTLEVIEPGLVSIQGKVVSENNGVSNQIISQRIIYLIVAVLLIFSIILVLKKKF